MLAPSIVVMAGLDPAIHVLVTAWIDAEKGVDHRVTPGDDDYGLRQSPSLAAQFAKRDTGRVVPGIHGSRHTVCRGSWTAGSSLAKPGHDGRVERVSACEH